MNERLKLLRKHLGLNQKEMGERIKLSQTHVSSLENGAREITDRIIFDVCREFDVNEQWLRTGEGEMFIESDSSIIVELANEYHLDEIDKKIIEHFVKLDSKSRQRIKDYVRSIAEIFNNEKAATYEEDNIEAELESYRMELEAEKKGQILSVSEKPEEKLG